MSVDAKQRASDKLARLAGQGLDLVSFWRASNEVLASAVPHYWAIRAWQQLVFDGEGVAAILPSLAALTAFAAVFIVLATGLLRRQLTR